MRVSNAAYGSEHYTEIDGGSVRTENLKVVPTIKDSLEFKQGGLVVRSEDSRLIVSKNGINQSVDNGRGQANSVKVKQNGTVFRTTNNGATGATETVIAGKTITAGDIVINGENGQSTITGLTNTTVDAPDFATQGRAATEEQLSAVRKEIKDSGRVINQQITNIDNRVDTIETGLSSVNQRVSNLDSRVNKVGAGAAALAALHPVSGDGTKFGVAAGVGIYNGQKAVSIGGSYSPNDMTTISVGGAVGNGENMVNAGVSIKVGAGNAMSKAQMNNQIKSLQAENSALKAKDVAQDTQLQELRAEIAALKASMTK